MSSIKRITKEINNFVEKKYESTNKNELVNKYYDDINMYLYTVPNYDLRDETHVDIMLNKKCILDLQIINEFPFKPYKVFYYKGQIEEKNYYKYLVQLGEKVKLEHNKDILNFFYQIKYGERSRFVDLTLNDCYCCSSITCSDKWSPSITMLSIIDEYREIEFLERYTCNMNYKKMKNIYNKLLTDSNFSKLPDDIVELILSYI